MLNNRFQQQQQPQYQQYQQSQSQPQQQDIFTAFNNFASNPVQALAGRGFNIPQQYQSSPQAMAQYMLQNYGGGRQNQIMQMANNLRQMFGR